MTKDELFSLARNASQEVIEKNQEHINKAIVEMFQPEYGSGITAEEAIGMCTVIATRMAPEISAAVTAKILLDTGLVSVEDP